MPEVRALPPLLDIVGLQVVAQDAGSARANANRVAILDSVDLRVHAGEVVGLIGESGAGKSTLGLAAMGYLRPGCKAVAGRVLFHGADLLAKSQRELCAIRGARIAYVAQSAAASFNPVRRLGDQVAEVLILHRGSSRVDALAQASELFAELALPEPRMFGRRFAHQVSGGQLQRAMIAMAIACGPELLIFDEPTTALDATTQFEVLATIRATLERHGAAALYISHDVAVVAQLADRVMVMRHGGIVETGTATEILDRPQADYTRRLLSAASAKRESSAPTIVPPRDGPPALLVSSLTASYASRQRVVRDVSLEVLPGKTLAIVGASGCGKSTLARAICGLLAPDAGAIALGGSPLAPSCRSRSREQLRRLQMVYQSPDTALNPAHRVQRILGRVVSLHFGGSSASVHTQVDALLAMVGLSAEVAMRRPSELSGGQVQRVGIARALAARPDVMVCDEVTSALDPLVAEEVLNLLAGLQRATGIALVFITHDIEVVRRIADDVAVMREGQFVDQGPPDMVFGPARHPYTDHLLSCVPPMRRGWLDEVAAREAPEAERRASASTGDLAEAVFSPLPPRIAAPFVPMG